MVMQVLKTSYDQHYIEDKRTASIVLPSLHYHNPSMNLTSIPYEITGSEVTFFVICKLSETNSNYIVRLKINLKSYENLPTSLRDLKPGFLDLQNKMLNGDGPVEYLVKLNDTHGYYLKRGETFESDDFKYYFLGQNPNTEKLEIIVENLKLQSIDRSDRFNMMEIDESKVKFFTRELFDTDKSLSKIFHEIKMHSLHTGTDEQSEGSIYELETEELNISKKSKEKNMSENLAPVESWVIPKTGMYFSENRHRVNVLSIEPNGIANTYVSGFSISQHRKYCAVTGQIIKTKKDSTAYTNVKSSLNVYREMQEDEYVLTSQSRFYLEDKYGKRVGYIDSIRPANMAEDEYKATVRVLPTLSNKAHVNVKIYIHDSVQSDGGKLKLKYGNSIYYAGDEIPSYVTKFDIERKIKPVTSTHSEETTSTEPLASKSTEVKPQYFFTETPNKRKYFTYKGKVYTDGMRFEKEDFKYTITRIVDKSLGIIKDDNNYEDPDLLHLETLDFEAMFDKEDTVHNEDIRSIIAIENAHPKGFYFKVKENYSNLSMGLSLKKGDVLKFGHFFKSGNTLVNRVKIDTLETYSAIVIPLRDVLQITEPFSAKKMQTSNQITPQSESMTDIKLTESKNNQSDNVSKTTENTMTHSGSTPVINERMAFYLMNDDFSIIKTKSVSDDEKVQHFVISRTILPRDLGDIDLGQDVVMKTDGSTYKIIDVLTKEQYLDIANEVGYHQMVVSYHSQKDLRQVFVYQSDKLLKIYDKFIKSGKTKKKDNVTSILEENGYTLKKSKKSAFVKAAIVAAVLGGSIYAGSPTIQSKISELNFTIPKV